MPVTFTILPRHDLVVVTYSGFAGIDETIQRGAECGRHPDFRPTMRHLIDLSRVTGYERDFPKFFAMQARLMEEFPRGPTDQMFVYFAPTRPGQEMVQMVRKSWEGLDWALLVALEDETDVMRVLGLPEDRIGSLLATQDAAEQRPPAAE
ncbi:hypothetical protein E7811_00040 [Aliigemmobacter aestuarii]|uniref:Uncharacterized protein n=1 Tax=Aliigemmobacter aestuarii TaxID=1445661 RepID=A0A4S3MRY9_9RHOB|nr:hypothetical protein [Gemmobacter aestuarii]THD84191.1 hypothetical protein E7811_00040 [Gemmobacter aestuarii]